MVSYHYISGANIFLSSNGSIKLGDFGLSVQLKNYNMTMPNEIKQQAGTVREYNNYCGGLHKLGNGCGGCHLEQHVSTLWVTIIFLLYNMYLALYYNTNQTDVCT